MKRFAVIILVGLSLAGCATGGGYTSGQSNTQTSSAEAQAKELTNKMKSVLSLDKPQEDKILTLNVVNQKLLQRLREDKDTSKVASAKESYHRELKAVLSAEQFSKFQSSFPNL